MSLPFSHEAVVAELDADADLATFQSFGHSGTADTRGLLA